MMRSLPFLLLCVVLGVAVGFGWQRLNRPPSSTAGLLDSSVMREAESVTELNEKPPVVPETSRPAYSRHSYHDGITRVAPSVVSLYARGSSENGNQGSGVIVDSNGIVLTNLHIIEGSTSITVVLSNGEQHIAELIGSDRETDLAVVRISRSGLPALSLNEAPPLRVGDIVLALSLIHISEPTRPY